MLVVKIAVPYAEALLELANANNSLKETTNDMRHSFSDMGQRMA